MIPGSVVAREWGIDKTSDPTELMTSQDGVSHEPTRFMIHVDVSTLGSVDDFIDIDEPVGDGYWVYGNSMPYSYLEWLYLIV